MSAEHFETILAVDARTSEDGRGAEYAPAGTGEPRLVDVFSVPGASRSRAWATVYPYAENVLRICADTVRDDSMSGLTGDHPEKRAQIEKVIRVVADAVRLLALDAAYDGPVTDPEWRAAMDRIVEVARDEWGS